MARPTPTLRVNVDDPVAFAESYLSSIPLIPASFLERVAAKVADFFVLSLLMIPAAYGVWMILLRVAGPYWGPALIGFAIAAILMSLPIYTMLSEYFLGYTLGKRLFNLHVVRESGARIGLGQSFVRQLPFFAQVFMIDALFALFTDKHQRAFELASKTRVIRILE